MSSPALLPGAALLKPGDTVRTPAGNIAHLVAICYANTIPEGLVIYHDGETARFRMTLLKPLPGKA